ncbi:MAG: EamA family transporter [candidate division NC10 bacterium]|nr:EamA family transporter [candidate division NC10 bacterium]
MQRQGVGSGMVGKRLVGSVMVAGAALLWGHMGVLAKFLFNRGEVSPLPLAALRSMVAFSFLFLFLALRRRRTLAIPLEELWRVVIVGVALGSNNFLYYLTITFTTVATALLLQYMAPLLVALFSVILFKERLTKIIVGALALAVGGCFLMVTGYDPNALRLNLPGLLTGLSSACIFAFYTLASKRLLARVMPWPFLLFSYAAAGLFWSLFIPPWTLLQRGYPPRLWALFLVIALFGTLLPFGLYVHGLVLLPATHVSIMSTLEPVIGATAAYLFLGESLTLPQILGGFLVISGVLLVQLSRASGGSSGGPPARFWSRASHSGGTRQASQSGGGGPRGGRGRREDGSPRGWR